ncbi:hypothetical protein [Saccharothrix violaceirubra]|uniref:Tetratricopeptide (TPR) repeat protein n=1 Tax=Saccharothrix violaceirubra TaxID=413306 RepID=A0A7W7T621_9PSEU|nr:hypothetical protein [Saccharothrix violaceirubra]MBB4967236.1 tetratricopeptide (TPR) repeat protein [Saccharothrix violaceirubra]
MLAEALELASDATERTATSINLAAVVDDATALELLTGLAGATAAAARAQLLARAGRVAEAWQDVESGLADASPREETMLRIVRTGLFMLEGRLYEAEDEATRSVDLARAHCPDLLAHPYENLAAIADAVGDHAAATAYRAAARDDVRSWDDLNARAIAFAEAGDRANAARTFEAAYRATLDSDDHTTSCARAVLAGNLAKNAPDSAAAVDWATEAITLATALRPDPNAPVDLADVLVKALSDRAHHLRHLSRFDEALADVEAAQGIHARPALRALKASVLVSAGRFAEGAAEARAALDLAYAQAPEVAAAVHATLAELADATGDRIEAAEQHGLARALAAAVDDPVTGCTAVLGLARLAYLEGDYSRADVLHAEAEALVGTDPAILHGRAVVAIGRGQADEALRLLESMPADGAGTPIRAITGHQLRGLAAATAHRYDEADDRYARAVEVAERAGLWHVVIGASWWRAESLLRWAVHTGETAGALSRRALDVALPAALAAEAVRHRFPHGPLRERWISLAAAPATRTALRAIGALGEGELAAAYLDHVSSPVSFAGPVSFAADEAEPGARAEIAALPPPTAEPDHLPYAASAFLLTETEVPGFALPPRVRPDPRTRTPLDDWIDLAERRYGFPVRGEGVVSSW